jgi:hypothetical protein
MKNLIRKILKESDFDWTNEVDVTWSTYYDEILNDLRGLSENVSEVTMDMVMPIWMKFSVLHRQLESSEYTKSKRWDGDLFHEIYYNLHSLPGTVQNQDQNMYQLHRDHLLGDITEILSKLRRMNESEFEWTEDVGPLQGFKFKVNHNSHTYVVDDDGDDTLGIRIVGDDDYRSTVSRSELKKNLDRRLWHDAKTYKFNPKLKIKENFDWAVEIKPEIDFRHLEDQPFVIEWKDGRVVDRGWRIGKVVEKNGKEYILIKGNKNEPWTRWKLILAFQGKMKKYKFKFKDDEIQRNWTITESTDFGWIDDEGIEASPNYEGYPQGVVYLRDHDEIKEFFSLLRKNGYLTKGTEGNIKDYHDALEGVRDRAEAGEYYDHWVPTITVSFFISKKDPSKYDTGYWDYDVDEGSVQDWLDDHGCEEEVIDCDNWKIYTDISQLRTLFNLPHLKSLS